jgi:hypothetical protein
MTTKNKKQAESKKDEIDQKKEEKSSWRIKTLADAFKPRPPREYIIEGLFPLNSMNIVFGAEGSMKSLLLMDMAICVSEGLPWLPYKDGGGYKFATKKSNVLYIDVDNGGLTDDERINAFALSRGMIADEKSNFKYMSMPEDFDISNKEVRNRIWILCQALNIKLLIMDNLGLINSKDENSHEMASVMSNLRWLSDKGMCIIIVHHQRKSNGTTSSLRETLRGHSSISAALDEAFLVSRRDLSEDFVTIIQTKARFAPVEVFGAHFQYTWIPETKELETAMFNSYDVDNENGKAYGLITLILQDENELTRTELVQSVMKHRISQKVARAAVEKAIEANMVTVRKGAHNTAYISLNNKQLENSKLQGLKAAINAK